VWGPIIPELRDALPGISIINRTTVNAFDEPRFAKADKMRAWQSASDVEHAPQREKKPAPVTPP